MFSDVVKVPPLMRITFDTNVLPAEDILALATPLGIDVAVVSVTYRETSATPFAATLEQLNRITETGVWGEGNWGEGLWASDEDAKCFEDALIIISGNSFPKPGARENLTPGQRRQLRDAIIFCAHVREGRDIFVTNDHKGFIGRGRREAIEARFATRVLTREELIVLLKKVKVGDRGEE